MFMGIRSCVSSASISYPTGAFGMLVRLNTICQGSRWDISDNVKNMFMGVRSCVGTYTACPTGAFGMLVRLNTICQGPRWDISDNVKNMFMGVWSCVRSTCIACPTGAFGTVPAMPGHTRIVGLLGDYTSWTIV